MLQDVVMRQGVQLKEKGEGSNIATLLQSLQAAVWAYNVRYAVMDGICVAQCGSRGTHPNKRGMLHGRTDKGTVH